MKNFNYIQLILLIVIISIIVDILTKKQLLFLPLITSLLLSALITQWGIKQLKKLQFNQIVRAEGPQAHYKKSGTPSMGGIIIVPLGIIIGNIISQNWFINKELIAISLLSIGFMIIGCIDDWLSISLNRSQGLTAKGKIFLQGIIAIGFLLFGYTENLISTNILLNGSNSINVGWFFWPLALFILLAESNATNLTDGLDGLASGCCSIIYTGLAIELILRGTNENYALASFCIAIAGTWLGFLIYNKNTAKIFMGDAGSLAIGASLAGIALVSNAVWSLFIMGGILLAESLSVIIQVLGFKISKRIKGTGHRFFLMAPLHHHLELKGKTEIWIVEKFWLLTIGLVMIALMLRSNI